MRHFMQSRLGCYGLPMAMGQPGCLSGVSHLGRARQVCSCCGVHAVGHEMHMSI